MMGVEEKGAFDALVKEDISKCETRFGISARGPWIETSVSLALGVAEEVVVAAAATAKLLSSQFDAELAQAKVDMGSLAERFVMETDPGILKGSLTPDWAGSCPMPIGKFDGKELDGDTVAEVFASNPDAIRWVGIQKAKGMLREATTSDRVLGVIACGVYWMAYGNVPAAVQREAKPRVERPSEGATASMGSDNTDQVRDDEEYPTRLADKERADAKRRDLIDAGQEAEDEAMARAADRAEREEAVSKPGDVLSSSEIPHAGDYDFM